MSNWTRVRFALGLLAIVSTGIALRSLSLLQSPLPFNPDGIIHARNAEITARTGQLPLSLDAVFVDDLGFGAFLAIIELLTGIPSLTVSQPVIAVVGTFPAVLAAVIARRFGIQLGWDIRSARVAGLLAGALLALEGVYLYRSMPVDEQTPGLSLVPLALVAVVYSLWTDDRRWLAVALPLLVYIPTLHNLESILLGLSLAALLGLAVVTPGDRRRVAVAAGALVIGYWLYLVAYNVGLEAFTPTAPHQNERVTAAPGLFSAWIILVFAGIAWFRRIRDRTKRAVLLVPFLVLFGVMGVNAAVPVFPGLPQTSPRFLFVTLALFIPTFVACWGYPDVADPPVNHTVLVALFAGPLTLIGFVLSAELTPVYFATGARTHWFLHLPVMIIAGVAVASLFRGRLSNQPVFRMAIVGLLLVSVVVSVPVAFAELSVYSYQGITTEGEFAASTFAHDRIPGRWVSDDHLVRISRYHPPGGSGAVAPVYSWVQDASAPPPDCTIVTKDSWTTVGAQFYPRPPATVTADRLESLDRTHHHIYDGGAADRMRVFQPRSESSQNAC